MERQPQRLEEGDPIRTGDVFDPDIIVVAKKYAVEDIEKIVLGLKRGQQLAQSRNNADIRICRKIICRPGTVLSGRTWLRTFLSKVI